MFIEQLFNGNSQYFFAVCVTVVVSICIHELAHGIVAIWVGDRTPIETGHMTLNPVVHMGLTSFILLLIAGIAWGRMPVDPRRMKGRFAPAFVAIAGPLSNVILAAISLGIFAIEYRMGMDEDRPLQFLLKTFGIYNIALAIFNMLPVPPLDGSRVLANLSADFANLMGSIRAAGGTGILFVLVFLYSGKLLFPAANHAAIWYVHLLIPNGQ